MQQEHEVGKLAANNSEQSPAVLDLSILWRRKWSLVACLLLTTGLGALYLSKTDIIYESEMRVLVQRNTLPADETKPEEDKFFLATQAEVIWSPVTVRDAVKNVPGAIGVEGEAVAVRRVLSGMQVTPLDDTNVLKIGLRDTNAARSHRILQAIIASYSDHIRQSEIDDRRDSTRVLAERADQISQELDELRKQFRKNRELNPLVGRGADALAIQMGSVKDLGSKLAESRKLRMEAENTQRITQRLPNSRDLPNVAPFSTQSLTKVETLEEQGDELAIAPQANNFLTNYVRPEKLALPMESDPKTVAVSGAALVMTGNPARINENLMDAQSEATRLAEHFGPRHPALAGIQKQVEWWNKCLEASKQEAAIVANQQVEVMKLTEQNLGELYAAEMDSLKDLDHHVQAEQELQDRIARLQDRHQETLASLSTARMTEQALEHGDSPVQIRVIEGREPAPSQVWPMPIQFLAVCAMIGLMGGCIAISLVEQLRLRSVAGAGNSRAAMESA